MPTRKPTRKLVARALATAFLAGDGDTEAIVTQGARLLGRKWRWLRPLVGRVLRARAELVCPRQVVIEKLIRHDAGFRRACGKYSLAVVELVERPTMRPLEAAQSWKVQALCTSGELAAWLELTPGELDWFADLRGLASQQSHPQGRHYQCRALCKQFGQFRWIEAPKQRLKAIQRQILTGILEHVPPHPAAHGFRAGHSTLTFAQPHVGSAVVIKLDLEDFFPSIRLAQVQVLFRALGYPEAVADHLAGLCSTATPLEHMDVFWRSAFHSHFERQKRRYARPHLPQGAPTSPALANLCAYRLDCRLTGLAETAGATYTRYADDLVFSGDDTFARSAKRFVLHVAALVLEEGFAVHHRKTRIMRQGVPQRIAGLVVNERLNVPRADFDRLKAILTNCVRLGPATQNRDGHEHFRSYLEGKVSYLEMVTPGRGKRLRVLLEQIQW